MFYKFNLHANSYINVFCIAVQMFLKNMSIRKYAYKSPGYVFCAKIVYFILSKA